MTGVPSREREEKHHREWLCRAATPLLCQDRRCMMLILQSLPGAAMNFPHLFSPLELGPYQLAHRVVMAPLTRMRAARPSLAPRPLNADYYAQRATSGGLIIAEASPVAATGHGNPGVPGIHTEAQVEGWRKVVDAVHAKGGIIFLQLW